MLYNNTYQELLNSFPPRPIISFPFVSELFKFPSSPSDSALCCAWSGFFYHSDVTGFDVNSEKELEKTQAVVDALIDKGSLTEDERDYLNLLGLLIHEYEQTQELVPDIFGVEILKVFMEEQNLKQKDLVHIFKTESIVSNVLNGKRQLTVEHIQKLADFFHIYPAVFFPISD